MGNLNGSGRSALYIDTNIFLNLIYREPRFVEGSRRLLELVDGGRLRAVTSAVTLLEVKLDMAGRGSVEVGDKAVALIEDIGSLEIVPLGKLMVKTAADHVLREGLTVHDSYHLATALHMKSQAFITRDEHLRKKIVKLIDVKKPEDVLG